MAYDPNAQDQNQQQNQAAQPNAMMTSSAPGAGPGSSAGKSTAPQATPSQPFQNLQAYLSANAPQVQQQADQISGNLNTQYGQVKSDVNNAQSDFGNQVQGGYAQPNPDITNQAETNTTAFAGNPDNVKAFQNLYNDTYTGPSNFESTTPYGALNTEVTGAANNATNFNTLPGMQTYFQGQNPNATQGGNTLDAVLLSGTPGAYNEVKQAAQPFGGLSDYLTNATNTADQGVTAAQKTAADTASGLQNAFTGTNGIIPNFENSVNSAVTNSQAQAQARSDAAKAALELKNPNDLNSVQGQIPKISDQTLADLGLGRDQLESILGQRDVVNNSGKQSPIDLASYLGLTQQSPDVVLNRANIASKDDYAKAQALSQLTGQDLTSFLNQGDLSKAGTANLNLSSISPNEITNLESLYNSEKPGLVPTGNYGNQPYMPNGNSPIIPPTTSPNSDNRPANTPFTIDPKTGNKIY